MAAPEPAPETNGVPPFIPILVYHAVADQAAPGRKRFTLERRNFLEHVRAIVESGRTALTVSQIAECMRGAQSWPHNPVAITFDDGYPDTAQSVRELTEAGLGATVYVTAGSTAGMIGAHGGISARSVSELAGMGPSVEIGAHSIHHPYLDELPRDEAAREISGSRDMLEQITGRRVTSFAYPYGAFSDSVRQCVIDAGYLSAVAAKNALARADDDIFSIARWSVRPATTAERVAEVLSARGIPLSHRQERVRTAAFRWTRKMRRRFLQVGPDATPWSQPELDPVDAPPRDRR